MTVGIDYIGVSTPFYCFDEFGKLLIHRRSHNCRDEQGRWDPGSGRLEFGDDPELNVLRELEEEYGCGGQILEVLPAISVVREEGLRSHWLAIPFIVRVKHDEVRLNEPLKMLEMGWFDLNNLPHPLSSAFDNYIVKTDRIKYLERYASNN